MPSAPAFRSEFLRTFVERGAYYAVSEPWEELDRLFASERVTAYIGFDCTAKSMHIGNLVQLMTLRRLQQHGHRPILLMGGGTTKAGDPSGKDEMRLILTPEQIEANKRSMLSGVRHLLQFGDGPADAIMVDNAEWLDRLEYIPFLREVGKQAAGIVTVVDLAPLIRAAHLQHASGALVQLDEVIGLQDHVVEFEKRQFVLPLQPHLH